MNINFLDFEQPIAELEAKIQELRMVGTDADINLSEEIARLETKCNALIKDTFSRLT
ncbi:MAG: acetyl-CoA carboxylase carboxyl transferase subunit alpha, partial [Gammaproteobacteria bacterium]